MNTPRLTSPSTTVQSIEPTLELDAVEEAWFDEAAPTTPADSLEKVGGKPSRIGAVLREVLAIAASHTNRTDNIKEVRAQLDPLVRELGAYYAAHRPTNEVELTRGAWRNVWFDNPDIDRGPFFLKLKRDSIYQVVDQGYYYNVSDSRVKVLGLELGSIHSFLRGNYTLTKPATEANQGQEGLNVISLEFADLRFKFGKRDITKDIRGQVDDIVNRRGFSLPSPGPRGIKGQLWNVYLDRDVRIAAGFQEDKPEELQLYILKRER